MFTRSGKEMSSHMLTLKGAPIAGYILDAYGGADSGFQAYRPAMYYAGSLAISAAGLIALARFRIKPNFWAKI